MNILSLLSGACLVISLIAIYKERTLTSVSAVLISVTLLVLTIGGVR